MFLDTNTRAEWVRSRLREETVGRQTLFLPDLCGRLEARLVELLGVAAVEELEHSASEAAGFRKLGATQFMAHDRRYEVRCVAGPANPAVLMMVVVGLGLGASTPRKRGSDVRISAPGRYTRVQVLTGTDQQASQEVLGTTAKMVLEAGGRWIEQYVLGEIGNRVRTTGQDLYAIIRQALPEAVASHVWLFSTYKNEGIYVSDPISRTTGLRHAGERLVQSDRSPIGQVAEMTTRVLDLNQLFAAEVLSSNTTLEVDITRATYSSTFELAEEAIFHTPSLTVQPLVREGKTRLIATYPSYLRSAVEPVLTIQRMQFQRVLDQTSKWLQSSLQSLNSFGMQPQVAGKLGEFAGGLLKEIAKVA